MMVMLVNVPFVRKSSHLSKKLNNYSGQGSFSLLFLPLFLFTMERLPHPSITVDRSHRTTLSSSSAVGSSNSSSSSSCGDETEDVLSLRLLMRSIKASAPIVKINPNQCKVLAKRLSQICDTLVRMPNKTPTPQLLSTFRAADFVINKMKAGGEWQSVLQQLFTCTAHFECLRTRIRQVWSLHSTASWDAEDRSANRKDEEHNVEMILLHVDLNAVEHLPAEVLTAAQRRFLEDNKAILPALLRQADPAGLLREVSSCASLQVSSFHVDPTATFSEPTADDGGNDTQQSDATVELNAIKASILHFYRRRYSSRWKISAEEIIVKQTPAATTASMPSDIATDGNSSRVVVSVRKIDDGNVEDDTAVTTEGFSANASYCSSHDAPSDLPLPSSTTLFPCPPPMGRQPEPLVAPPAAVPLMAPRGNLTAHPSRIFSFVPSVEEVSLEDMPQQTSHSPFSIAAAPSQDREMSRVVAEASLSMTHCGVTTNAMSGAQLAVRFGIDDGSVVTKGEATERSWYEFRSQKVVIKRLRDTPLLTPETLEMFVVDVACRVRWCHPNLVTFHGAFCEEFNGEASRAATVPYLSLGLVMSDLYDGSARAASASLQQLLFLEGKKFSLADAIRIVLQVADALQFCLFDSDDVPSEVLERWRWISPSNIFVWDSRNAAVRDDVTTVGVGRYLVQYSPPLTIANGPVSRWAPHPMASNPECYALTQLLISLLTNQQPFHHVVSQTHLQALRERQKRVGAADSAAHVMGMSVPKYLPEQLQALCAIGLRLKQAPPPDSQPTVARSTSFISRFMKTQPANTTQPQPSHSTPSQSKPYSLLLFRNALNDLLPMADSLPKIDDINADHRITSFVCETAVDDYGWVEPAKVFDRHDV